MSTQYEKGKPIFAGIDWRYRVEISGSSPIAATDALYSHVRAEPSSPTVLATLRSDQATLIRVNSTTIDIVIPGLASVGWEVHREVSLDIIRHNGVAPDHMGFSLTIPVRKPITDMSAII